MAQEVRTAECAASGANNSECPICLESFDEENQKIYLESCVHSFCRTCLLHHCCECIECKILPIPCPRGLGNVKEPCYGSLNDTTVKEILEVDSPDCPNEKWWRWFRRFSFLVENPDSVMCPECHEMVNPSSSVMANADPSQIECMHCCHSFCKVHGDVHRGVSCQSYVEAREIQEGKSSESLILAWTKKCSHCGSRIQKSEGCDHIVCPACGNDMCFKCGTHRFLSGKYVRKCTRCQQGYVDHRHQCMLRLRLMIMIPVLVILAVLWMVVAVALFFLSCFFCGFCVCGKAINTDAGDSKVNACYGARKSFEFMFLPFLALSGEEKEPEIPSD